MKAIQCLTVGGTAETLRVLEGSSVPACFSPFLASGRLDLFGVSPVKSVSPKTSFKVLGAVDAEGIACLALGVDGAHGALLCEEEELSAMRRLITTGGKEPINSYKDGAGTPTTTPHHAIDAYECLVRTLSSSCFVPCGEFVSLILEQMSLIASDMASEVAGLERILKVSDRLKRQRTPIKATFPYHCGSDDHAQKRFFCVDEHVCNQFIPSIQHGDKVLTRHGVATFVGIGPCGDDWAPYWHCAGSVHAAMWLEGHLGRRIVIGKNTLVYNGPSRECAMSVGAEEDVRRYLFTTSGGEEAAGSSSPSSSKDDPFDKTNWLNEGLFGVKAGDKIGSYSVLGVAPSEHFPSSRLELYLKDLASEEVIPLSRTRGLSHLA